jgi:MFS family permease
VKKFFSKLPKSIWILGLTGFLINMSTIMVFSQMPIFMKTELGISEHTIGTIDGFVEFISHAMRIVAGSVSDMLQNRKAILGLGYGLSALVKPLFALSSSVGFVILIRSMDRITNGLQASPRDALIGDLAPKNRRGSSYGLSKSLKTAGSVIGAGIVVWIMTLTGNNFRLLFSLAFIPAVLALVIFIFGVKEPKAIPLADLGQPQESKKKKFNWRSLRELKKGYWKIIALLGICELAHFGESYLTFRAAEVGVDIAYISLVMLLFNMGQFLSAFPIGTLSDRFQRQNILLVGFSFMLLANICMMYGTSPFFVYLGVFFWGAQMGTTQSVFVSMISDEAPKKIRGTAFGIFYIVMGIDIMIASKVAGVIWEGYGSTYAFRYSALMTLFSIVCLFFLIPRKKTSALSQ